MTARDYSITFGYGEYDGVYYTASRPHRGNDRPTPTGTPIVIGDTQIGLTGATGLVSGPHLHTQAGTDTYCQQTVDPTPYEFQIGTVVVTGNASQWGNYVIVRTLSGIYVCYAHLSAIQVNQGHVIGAGSAGGNAVETIKSMYWRLLGREADAGGIGTYTKAAGERGWEFVYNDIKNSPEGQRDWERRNPDRVNALEAGIGERDRVIADLRTALANEQGKPPVEVIKEVEKIVEVPVEVIKEVPVYVNDEETRKTVVSIKMMLVNFIGYVKNKLGR